ncbi:MAG: YraN family protein [Rickettsia sp.]|nr:YraN family protein [Rickettsia sp.]
MKLSNFLLGKIAEYFVIFLYKICFYKIMAHRLRNVGGEIDIIAKKRDLIVFIEVKSRRKNLSYYGKSILSQKQKLRIIQSAKIFLAKKKLVNCEIRFDLVILQRFNLPIILKNAWGSE